MAIRALFRIFVALFCLAWGDPRDAGAQGLEVGDQPLNALSLHLCFDNEMRPRLGPAPLPAGGENPRLLQEAGRSFLRLGKSEDKAGGAAVGTWIAADILSNAQGGLSFFVRFPRKEVFKPGDKVAYALMKLVRTGGGEWTLFADEVDEVMEKRGKEDASPELPAADLSVDSPNKEGDTGLEEAGVDLSETEKPIGTIRCAIRMKLFADGGLESSVSGGKGIFEKGQWHQVVWSWRSIWHCLYLDGKLLASGSALSRLEPLSNPEGVFQILSAPADLADLRIYWRALEPGDVDSMYGAKGDRYLPPLAPFRLWADWGLGLGRAVVYADVRALPVARVELACVEVGSGSALKKENLENFPSGLGEARLTVTPSVPFPPGTYRFEGVARRSDGKELARARTADWTAQRLEQPWYGCRIGLDTKIKIVPPFTAIEVEGNMVRTVLREHQIDRTGFFRSVVATGSEILAGPVAFQVLAGQQVLAFTEGMRFQGVENKEDEADWTASGSTSEGHTLEVHGHIEYDGVARFDVALIPRGRLEVTKAELRLPFRPPVLKRIHSVATGFIHRFMAVSKDTEGFRARSISWSVGMPEKPRRGPGVIFDSNDLHETESRFRFTPFIHVGNNYRGMTWFADNDSGWVHDPGNTPAIEVVATEGERYLRLNVVARPVTLERPLQFRFYLLANPFKPLPEDWRTWVLGNAAEDAAAARSRHLWWWHWNEYAESFYPYPGGVQKKKYEDWVGKFKDDKVIHTPFINFGVPAGSGLYGPSHFIEMAKLPYTWKLHTNRLLQDYMVYWLDKCVREIGIGGVYVDEPYDQPSSYNLLGCDAAYIRPDGTRGAGFIYSEGREYLRRLKQMFAEHGLDYSLWVHTSSWKALPMLTFADMSMDGEWPAIWVSSFSNYHQFYNREKSRGYLSGIPFGFVGAQMLNANVNPKTFPEVWLCSRTYLGVTLPCGVIPYSTNIPGEFHRINSIREAFGIFDPGLEELDIGDEQIWLPGSHFEPGGLRMGGTLNKARDQALLYVIGHGVTGSRFELVGGFQDLRLGKPHVQAWNAENGVSLLVDDRIILERAPEDTTVVLVRGTEVALKSRPEGAILGISFDQDFEPDFGGGMVPVSFKDSKTRPERVAGYAGQAMSFGYEESPVGYPVIPSWICGTLEFDVRIHGLEARPLQLVALQHHLQLSLSCLSRDGRAGLLLITSEIVPHSKLSYSPEMPPAEDRSLFAPLPEFKPGEWNHVALAWRSGQYDLYWNGKLLGRIFAAAAPRLQDAAAMAAGVWLGDGSGMAPSDRVRVDLDSFLLYDWPFTQEVASAAKGRPHMSPVSPPQRQDSFPVRLWGVADKDFTHYTIGVHLRGFKDWEKVSAVKLLLYDKENLEAPIGIGEIRPWLGTGFAQLTPLEASLKVSDAAKMELTAEDKGEEESEETEPEKEMILQVELLSGESSIAKKRIKLVSGMDGPTGEY